MRLEFVRSLGLVHRLGLERGLGLMHGYGLACQLGLVRRVQPWIGLSPAVIEVDQPRGATGVARSRCCRLGVARHELDLSEHRCASFGIRLAGRLLGDGAGVHPRVSPLFERQRPSVSPQFGLHDRDDPTQGLRNGVEQTEHDGNRRAGLAASPACREIGMRADSEDRAQPSKWDLHSRMSRREMGMGSQVGRRENLEIARASRPENLESPRARRSENGRENYLSYTKAKFRAKIGL
jgi:hypothetical protein